MVFRRQERPPSIRPAAETSFWHVKSVPPAVASTTIGTPRGQGRSGLPQLAGPQPCPPFLKRSIFDQSHALMSFDPGIAVFLLRRHQPDAAHKLSEGRLACRLPGDGPPTDAFGQQAMDAPRGAKLLPDVTAGVQFTDGVKSQEVAA